MRGLSLWQPWATLMALDAKRFETRSWASPYRGPIAIHASKNRQELELCLEEPFRAVLVAGGIHKIGDLPFGAFVAVGELIACYETPSSSIPMRVYHQEVEKCRAEHEYAFGNYEPQRFAWKFVNVRSLVEPIPARGFQGLWNIEPELAERLAPAVSPGNK